MLCSRAVVEEEVREAGSKIAALTQKVESLRQASQSAPRSDEVTALLVDKNAARIATGNALFAALCARVLAYIPPLNAPMGYKAQLPNALPLSSATVAVLVDFAGAHAVHRLSGDDAAHQSHQNISREGIR